MCPLLSPTGHPPWEDGFGNARGPLWGLASTWAQTRPLDLHLMGAPGSLCHQGQKPCTATLPRGMGHRQEDGGFAWIPEQIQAPLGRVPCPRPAPGSPVPGQVCAPASWESGDGTYAGVLPLMASREGEARTPPVCRRGDWGGPESHRVCAGSQSWAGAGARSEPSSGPSQRGQQLHPSLPGSVGRLCGGHWMDRARGRG